MDTFYTVIYFAVAMFMGSFFFGTLPLMLNVSPRRLNEMSALGAGLLLGTAFLIILPEGVETLLEAYEHSASETNMRNALGISFSLGFVLMLLLEHSGLHLHAHSRSNANSGQSSVVLIGLVVHAIADGIALGAASSSNEPSLKTVVFAAIMIHKGPSAFGLVAFLLKSSLPTYLIRRNLILFSMAAPVFTILCYWLLSILAASEASPNMCKYTGCLLLFSAGTFLYVSALDILPSVLEDVHCSGHNSAAVPLSPLCVSLQAPVPVVESSIIPATHLHPSSHIASKKPSVPLERIVSSERASDELVTSFNLASSVALAARSPSLESPEDGRRTRSSQAKPSNFKIIVLLVLGIFAPLLLNIGHAHH